MWKALQCNSGWYMSDAIGLHFIAYFINSVLKSYDCWFKVCFNMFSLLWPLALAVDLPQRSLPEDIPDDREKPELWWKLWVFMRSCSCKSRSATNKWFMIALRRPKRRMIRKKANSQDYVAKAALFISLPETLTCSTNGIDVCDAPLKILISR